MTSLDTIAIENFRTYLRIHSVQPNVDYSGCITFLTSLAKEIGLECDIVDLAAGKPILIMTLTGQNPDLPSIVLNSHMDVVPVYPELWHHDPFAAEMDDAGNIYARGAQDMKSVGIQYLEAIRRLLNDGSVFQRTIRLFFMPDEEDGTDGMQMLVNSPYFAPLNVGFVLDESNASPTAEYLINYAEKAIWHAVFKVPGTEGHGSLALPDTAGEKLRRLLDQLIDYRQAQQKKLAADPSLEVGDITFLNLTEISGGVAPNVVPAQLTATVDIRLAVDENHDNFEALLQSWCKQAGDGITIEYIAKEPPTPPTSIDDSNLFWVEMKRVFASMNQKVITSIQAGGTDSRFLRRVGIPCICFSPMNYTESLAHANDEYLNKDVFLRGIEVYQAIITSVANLE